MVKGLIHEYLDHPGSFRNAASAQDKVRLGTIAQLLPYASHEQVNRSGCSTNKESIWHLAVEGRCDALFELVLARGGNPNSPNM